MQPGPESAHQHVRIPLLHCTKLAGRTNRLPAVRTLTTVFVLPATQHDLRALFSISRAHLQGQACSKVFTCGKLYTAMS